MDTSKNVCQNTNSLRLLCDREYSKLRKSLLDQQRFSSARWSEGFRWAAVKWLGLGAVACGRQGKQRKAGSRMSSYCASVWGEGEPSFNGLSYTLCYLSTLLALTWFVLMLQHKRIWNHMMRRMHLGMSVIFSFNSQFCHMHIQFHFGWWCKVLTFFQSNRFVWCSLSCGNHKASMKSSVTATEEGGRDDIQPLLTKN